MAGEWIDTTLGDVTDFLTGFPFKSARYVEDESAPRLLRGDNVVQGVLRWDGAKRWPSDAADETAQYRLCEGDVILAMDRPWIEAGLKYAAVRRSDLPALLVQRVARLRGSSRLDTGFLKWVIGSQAFTDHVLAVQTGTAVPHISGAQIKSFEFLLPPLSEQRAIAHILGTLDDKIELNRRMSETLEAMARALFKSWFVDFDPVRAKAEGRLPALPGRQAGGRQATPAWPRAGVWCVYAIECEDGSLYIGHTENIERRYEEHSKGKGADWTKRHPPKRVAYWEEAPTQTEAVERERKLKSGSGREWLKLEIAKRDLVPGELPKPPCLPDRQVADLFPDSFEDSELGEIPKGWEVKTIGDLADVVGGTTPSTKQPAYWDGGAHAWATPKDLSGLSVPVLLDTERRITDAGLSQVGSGLLPKGTVLLSSRAPIGYLAVAEIPVAINQGFIAMTPKAGTSNLFLLLWAVLAHEEIVSRANGSTFLEISKANFRPIPVVVPPAGVMHKFEQLGRPLYERIVECTRESRTLAAMRDALLPKLISGELRVSDAEKFIGGSV